MQKNAFLSVGTAALLLAGTLANPLFVSAKDANLLKGSWNRLGSASEMRDGRLILEDDDRCPKSKKVCAFTAGSFSQDVSVKGHGGDYALVIAYTRAEDVRSGDNVAGLPYLYGYLLDADGRIQTYLQGSTMRHPEAKDNIWGVSYGIYKVGKNDKTLRTFLKQGSRKGTERDGRAAEFYKPSVFLVGSEKEANDIMASYRKDLKTVKF